MTPFDDPTCDEIERNQLGRHKTVPMRKWQISADFSRHHGLHERGKWCQKNTHICRILCCFKTVSPKCYSRDTPPDALGISAGEVRVPKARFANFGLPIRAETNRSGQAAARMTLAEPPASPPIGSPDRILLRVTASPAVQPRSANAVSNLGIRAAIAFRMLS